MSRRVAATTKEIDVTTEVVKEEEASRYVVVVEEFPMTVTGKVRKVEMRERSVELLDLGDAAGVRTA